MLYDIEGRYRTRPMLETTGDSQVLVAGDAFVSSPTNCLYVCSVIEKISVVVLLLLRDFL
ncbi:hypothetical protein [Candidatus Pandoraea novymonadis]|nr:hypothetical protein [Candidatus Pandoraea novymonadis]